MEYIDAIIEGGYEPVTDDLFSVRYKKTGRGEGKEYSDIKRYIDNKVIGGGKYNDGADLKPIDRDDYGEEDIFLVTPIDLDNPLASGMIGEVNDAILSDVIGFGEDAQDDFDTPPIGGDEISDLLKQFKD